MKRDRYAELAGEAWRSYMRYVVHHTGKITEDQRKAHEILAQTIPMDIQRYPGRSAWNRWIKQMIPPIAALVLSIIGLWTALSK